MAVLTDAGDDRAEAANIALASYARLYEAIRKRCRQRLDAITASRVEAVIRECETQTGVTLTEAALCDQFQAIVLARIMPAARLRAVLEDFARRRRTVRVWGLVGCDLQTIQGSGFRVQDEGSGFRIQDSGKRGGPNFPAPGYPRSGPEPRTLNPSSVDCRPLPTGDGIRAVFDGARVIFVPTPMSDWSQWILDALFVGLPVVAAALPNAECGMRNAESTVAHSAFHTLHSEFPRLAEVFSHVIWFTRLSDGIRAVERELARDRPALPEAQRRMILERHSMGERLKELMDTVRRRWGSDAATKRRSDEGTF